MAQNVEIKARIAKHEFGAIRERTKQIATDGPIHLEQTDTFFACQTGRLKLREFDEGTAELIAYHRPDTEGPKTSTYIRSQCDGETMKVALGRSLGIIGVVQKEREVFFQGPTRIHLDRVEGLGTFLELEVVLDSGHGSAIDKAEGQRVADHLMKTLGIEPTRLIAGAYFDLLQTAKASEH